MTMCGICGVVQVAGESRRVIEPEVLDRMTDVLRHRGPDDRGTYEAPRIALGARRLSIVDVAGGHQPIANEDDRVWAVQNGELYNHLDIRTELRRQGHVLRTNCDTEIIPHLYEQHGPAFVEKLRGKFAIAVWDERERRAVLARDRLGVKPLYYAQRGDLLIFASELKSVLASGLVPMDLDLEALELYLTFGFVPAPRTPIAGVSKLLPGHCLVAGRNGVSIERYWTPPEPVTGSDNFKEDDVARELLALLEESVRLRLMSDVPLGAMLSGGLDSSLVVGLMSRHMSEPVKTFSVAFSEAGDANELADARRVADVFSTDHHELELSASESTVDLAELTWSLDEPIADLSTVGFSALSELATRHVTVALSGQGADELLAGYARHRNAALVDRFEHLPALVRGAGAAAGRLGFPGLKRLSELPPSDDPVGRLLTIKAMLNPDLRQDLFGARLRAHDQEAARRVVAARLNGHSGSLLTQTLHLDLQLGLVDDMLHYFDRASMAHSLEVRVPFLDHELVEFCARIPSRLKVRGRTTKYILRRAARGIVPDEIIDKRKIGFFSGAVRPWFRAQAEFAVRDYLLDPSARYREFLQPDTVERLATQSLAGRSQNIDLVLSILMLEVWLSSFVPRAARPGQPRTRERISA
jgi:asparagine synthase (glutamine-hydrolysing)